MRPRLFLLLVFLSFLIPRPVQAQTVDYVSLAIEVLKSSNVYVAPGTPGTGPDTREQLSVFLTPELNVVLVMLPADALTGTDAYTLAKSISEGLNNQRVVGLAVGQEVAGYSTMLPADVTADLMNRADSVSNNPITALVTFSRNVQLWLIRNPQPKPTLTPEPPPTPRPTMAPIVLPKAEDVSWPIWVLLSICALALFVLFSVKAKQTIKEGKQKDKLRRRLTSLEPINLLIQKIEANVAKIKDSRVRKDLERACNAAHGLLEIFQQSEGQLGYTEAKFPSLLQNVNRQVVAFIRDESGRRPLPAEHLTQLRSVLLNYDSLFIKLQENDPEAVELLTSIIDSNNTMISSLGYLSEE